MLKIELWSALGSIGPKVNFVFLGNIPIKSQNSILYAAYITLWDWLDTGGMILGYLLSNFVCRALESLSIINVSTLANSPGRACIGFSRLKIIVD